MANNQYDDNETLWAADLNAVSDAIGSGGIINGCSISKGTGDWDIDVTSGQIIESNTEASISSGTVTITDSSALGTVNGENESRVTIITADTGDNLASTDGTAAVEAASPDVPAGEVLLGFVVVTNGDSTAADSDIFDIPALIQNDSTRYEDGGSHEIDAANFTGNSGTAGQVLGTDGSAAAWEDKPISSPPETAAITNVSIAASSRYTPTAGVYNYLNDDGNNPHLEIGSHSPNIQAAALGGTVVADGSNVSIFNDDGASANSVFEQPIS